MEKLGNNIYEILEGDILGIIGNSDYRTRLSNKIRISNLSYDQIYATLRNELKEQTNG